MSLKDIKFLSPPKTIIISPITMALCPSLAQGFFPLSEA